MEPPTKDADLVRVISSKKTFGLSDFRELWHYRELFYFFAWRDYKIRYKETVIGALWAFLQPFLTMLIFVLFFGRFKEISTTGIPYALFAYSGLIFWHFLSNSVQNASNSLINNTTIITKVYFPRIIIPLSSILVFFIDLFCAFIILMGLLFYFGIMPHLLVIVATPFFVLLLAIAVAGISLLLSSLTVRYRDVKHVIPFFIQLSLFVSPVIYTAASLGNYAWLMELNPLTGVINGFRAVLFGLEFPLVSVLYSTVIAIALFVFGVLYFKQSEKNLSDII